MTRKAYRENYALIDWGPPRQSAPVKQKPEGPKGPFVMPDIAPFVSPLDFSVVSSRSMLREHERRHGVRQCGELKSPKDFDNASRRTGSFREKSFDSAFKSALEKTGL